MESFVHQVIGSKVVPEGAGPGAGAIDNHLGTAIIRYAEVLDTGHQLAICLVIEIYVRVRPQVLLHGGVQDSLDEGGGNSIVELYDRLVGRLVSYTGEGL